MHSVRSLPKPPAHQFEETASSSRVKESTKERIRKETETISRLRQLAHERVKQELIRKSAERKTLFFNYFRSKQQRWKAKTSVSPLHDDLTSDIHQILKILHQNANKTPKKLVLKETHQKEFSPMDEALLRGILTERETLVLSAFKLDKSIEKVKEEEKRLSKSTETGIQRSFRRLHVDK